MIIPKNVCEINYYKHEHICVFMLINLDVKMYDSYEAICFKEHVKIITSKENDNTINNT